MKQTLIIIFTLALLGIAGVAEKTQSAHHQLVAPSSANTSTQPATTNRQLKDGSYTGASEFTPYGTVQIAVVVSGGKITDVNFLQMPSDQRESQQRTTYSEPLLKQTTIAHQSANIDFVTGATDTSAAYQQSLQAALNQAAQS